MRVNLGNLLANSLSVCYTVITIILYNPFLKGSENIMSENAQERKISEHLSVPNEQDIVAPLFEESLEAENPKKTIE